MSILPKLSFIVIIITFGLVAITRPSFGIILIMSIVVHELGHIIVAKYYGVFEGFILVADGFGIVHKRPDTYSKSVHITMSGFLFSLIPILVGGILFLNLWDLFTVILAGVLASVYDFINIIKRRKYYKEKRNTSQKGNGQEVGN